ncbi:STAS domain-containing protein [Roseibium sp. MMSF_3544]|uniref:STAS domain-containing protein n=2 Tax=unclassified Roseibium TaxID=2629323 RepID=UPI00273DFF40|nr:STAS domain-containing protein [Roseibium sp. MMSF_3544]
MNFEIYKENDICILRPTGRMDKETIPEFEELLFSLIDSTPVKLLIDMQRVTFLAGAALGVLLAVAKRLSGGADRLCLFGLSGRTREVFEVSGFVSILEIHSDEISARGEVR